MPSAELIAIGTELLLGEIQDTNSRFLARKLRNIGVDLFRTTCIGDNAGRVASAVNEALSRVDIVITTGGLGPTVDDPTREAITIAFDTTVEFHPELWTAIENRFLTRGITPTVNNQRQAYIPMGADVINNPVGTAPAFSIQCADKIVFCLPGVPAEMEQITEESVLPLILHKYNLHSIIKVRVLHLSGVGESAVDQPITEFEKYSNPTVGLLAHPGIVDIRITAKADDPNRADEMIWKVESQIVKIFPHDIFGYDEQTLSGCLIGLCERENLTVKIHSFGLSNWPLDLQNNNRFSIVPSDKKLVLQVPAQTTNDLSAVPQIELCCNFSVQAGTSHLDYSLVHGDFSLVDSMLYNGPQAQGPLWAINRLLDLLRRNIPTSSE